jgi:hypothetical protein
MFWRLDTCLPSPCGRLSRPRTTTEAPLPWGSRPVGNPAFIHRKHDLRLRHPFRTLFAGSLPAAHRPRDPCVVNFRTGEPMASLYRCHISRGELFTAGYWGSGSLAFAISLRSCETKSRMHLPALLASTACGCPLWLSPPGKPLTLDVFISRTSTSISEGFPMHLRGARSRSR